jgi:hypothetical protein
MKAMRQLGIVVLLLVSYMTPTIACMASDLQMRAGEHACCRAMHHHCEQMGMSASSRCCQKTPQSDQDDALITQVAAYHPITVAAIWLTTAEWFPQTLATGGRIEHPDYSPPESPPGSISVLRI